MKAEIKTGSDYFYSQEHYKLKLKQAL